MCRSITYRHVVSRFIKLFYWSGKGIYRIEEDIYKGLQVDKLKTIGTDFSTFEIIGKIWWMKPIFCCCRSARCAKNADQFSMYFDLITNEHLDFFTLYKKFDDI